MMDKQVLVFLADGLEEIEAITSIDVLRRAGLDVTTVTLADKQVHGSHGIDILADEEMENVIIAEFAAVVLPGGMPGAKNLRDNPLVIDTIKKMDDNDRLIAAICAAPMALDKAGILDNHKFTIHPSVEDQVAGASTGARTMVDGNVITGIGPGAAIEFAYKIVEKLVGPDKVEELNSGIFAKL
jgi:4-methyl-5(b-hydroxyethyl)-thiazole monophosphate biosynthesis